MSKFYLFIATFYLLVSLNLQAEVKLPSIFGSHMVLQRDHANPVWGWAAPSEKITVSIAGQSHNVTTGKDGSDGNIKAVKVVKFEKLKIDLQRP